MRRFAISVILLMLTPLAAAESVTGEVATQHPWRLDGRTHVTNAGTAATLMFEPGDDATLTWANMTGVIHERRGTRSDIVGEQATPSTRALRSGPGALTDILCRGTCVLWFAVDDDTGRLGLQGTSIGQVAARDDASGQRTTADLGAATASARVEMPIRAFTVGDASVRDGLRLDAPSPTLSGTVRLILWNVNVTLASDAHHEALATGISRTSTLAAGDVVVSEDIVHRYAVLTLEGAAFAGSPRALRLVSAELDVDIGGAVSAGGVSGRLIVDGRPHDLDEGDVLARGNFRLHLTSPDDAQRIAWRGAADEMWLSGVKVAAPVSLPPTGAAVGLVVALALGAIVLLKTSAFAAFYARITRSRVLTHDGRRAIHEHIRDHPGTHVSEIARTLGMSRVGVQHHLRLLEVHKLVVSRASGRVLAYFAPDRVPDGATVAIQVAMKGQTRQRILETILQATRPLTQQDLAERTGASQRLVSYHLGRLEEMGLVTGDDERPRGFRAPEVGAPSPAEARA